MLSASLNKTFTSFLPLATKYIILLDSLSCLQPLHEADTSFDLDGDTVVSFLKFANKKLCFVGYLVTVPLMVIKGQTAPKLTPALPRVKVSVP